MESLKIKTGEISLSIEDDNGEKVGVFKLNPTDLQQANKLMNLTKDFLEKQKEFNEKSKECKTDIESVMLLEEVVDYFVLKIDDVYGKGSSEVLFRGAKTLTMFDDFFKGIAKYYKKESDKRKSKYAK